MKINAKFVRLRTDTRSTPHYIDSARQARITAILYFAVALYKCHMIKRHVTFFNISN